MKTETTEVIDPADPYLLNCLNGIVDLRTGQLVSSRGGLSEGHHCCSAEYDPAAKAPVFTSFVNQAMGGDQKRISYLQRLVGYALTGHVSERSLFVIGGRMAASCGKTTFLAALRSVFGTYSGNVENPISDVSGLKDLRLAIIGDDYQGALSEKTIKTATEGGVIKAVRRYHQPIEFTATHKVFMDCSVPPRIRVTDAALFARVKVVSFSCEITPANIDVNLGHKLLAERSGILAWAVQGSIEWSRYGLGSEDQ